MTGKIFQKTVAIGIEALDTVIEENQDNHPLQTQKDNSLNYRNVGLGVMGVCKLSNETRNKIRLIRIKEFC